MLHAVPHIVCTPLTAVRAAMARAATAVGYYFGYWFSHGRA